MKKISLIFGVFILFLFGCSVNNRFMEGADDGLDKELIDQDVNYLTYGARLKTELPDLCNNNKINLLNKNENVNDKKIIYSSFSTDSELILKADPKGLFLYSTRKDNKLKLESTIEIDGTTKDFFNINGLIYIFYDGLDEKCYFNSAYWKLN